MQFSQQTSPANSAREGQRTDSPEQFVPLLTQINQKLIDEEPLEDDSDVVFDYDLLLPPPNPLPFKSPTPREPLKIKRKVPKFVGKELIEQQMTKSEALQKTNNALEQKIKELRGEQNEGNEQTEQKKLTEFFSDKEKVVYQRRSQKGEEMFNQAPYNIKAQRKRNIEGNEREMADETNANNNNKDRTLRFESRFESGNLSMASLVNENEYNLILQSDVNTKGYGQWFFFEVTNGRKNQTVKFNILNYRKSSSLHNQGMRILVYSIKEAQKSNIGWYKTTQADYFCNYISRENPKTSKHFRTLSFEYTFKHNYDRVFFAYSHPYTYTDLLDYLDSVEIDHSKSRYFGRSTLCRTVAGNKCELVTITQNRKPGDCEKKKCIVLAARVHPGETNSSYVIQGIIEYLLSNSKEAEALREKFIFKIIPMLNPDGVIHGNSRCSLAGCDLNRKWQKPSPRLHPTIYYTKRLISELNSKYKVLLFCDFHGHSKKRDMFLYGCQVGNLPLETREFAWVLSRMSPLFSYRKSSFYLEMNKMGTARVNLYQELKIKYSYTLETSFYGSEKAGVHYSINDLLDFGSKFCNALLIQFSREVPTTKELGEKKTDQELIDLKRKMIEEFYSKKEHLNFVEEDSGSESEMSEDDLPAVILKDLLPKIKKRIIKNSKSQKITKTLNIGNELKNIKTTLERTNSTKQKSIQKSPTGKKGEKCIEKLIQDNSSSSMINGLGVTKIQEKFSEQEVHIPVEKKLHVKEEPKRSVIQPLNNLEMSSPGFAMQKENKLAKSSMILPPRRLGREREDKASGRIPRERKFVSNGPEVKKQAVFPVVTLNFTQEKTYTDKNQSNIIGTNAVRSLKELKSGRNLISFADYGLEPGTSNNMSKDNMIEFLEARNAGIYRNMYEFQEIQIRPRQEKKARAMPRILEPLGKCIIIPPVNNELDTGKNDLKTKKSIRHAGFRKREEDGVYREEVSPYNSTNIIRELFGLKPERPDKTEAWKLPLHFREEAGKEKLPPPGMVSVKNLTMTEKESQNNISQGIEKLLNFKDLFRKEEAVLKHSRSEITHGGRFCKDMKNLITPQMGDLKTPVSLDNTPKGSLNVLKSLSTPTNPKGVLKNMLG